MTMTATQNTKDRLGTRWSLSVFASKILGYRVPASVREGAPEPASQTDHVGELLKKIDHGYIVEETGKRAYIPRFARAWLQSSISSGDWV